MRLCFGVGYNDVPGSSRSREYHLWHAMIQRCYDPKVYGTYKDCYVCDRWLTFSTFCRDIKKLDNYSCWLNSPGEWSLDKDTKQVGVDSKVYSLDTCMFLTKGENTREAMSRRDMSYNSRKCGCKEPDGSVHEFDSIQAMADYYGRPHATVYNSIMGYSDHGVYRNYNGVPIPGGPFKGYTFYLL